MTTINDSPQLHNDDNGYNDSKPPPQFFSFLFDDMARYVYFFYSYYSTNDYLQMDYKCRRESRYLDPMRPTYFVTEFNLYSLQKISSYCAISSTFQWYW